MHAKWKPLPFNSFIFLYLSLFNLLQLLSRYERLLRRARTEDLSEVSGIGCLYQSGVDRLGRPVVVFCGKWFPAHNIDLEKALLYLIYLLDPIVKGDYVIAYFHTLTNSNNYPSLHWLKEVYSILPYKCVSRLDCWCWRTAYKIVRFTNEI